MYADRTGWCILAIPDGIQLPIRLYYTSSLGQPVSNISHSTGPLVSISLHSSAHPSPLHLVYRPIRYHCALFLRPTVSIAPSLPAHSSPLYTGFTIIHNLLYSTFLYYHLYYIPLAHPFTSGTQNTLGPLVYHGTISPHGPTWDGPSPWVHCHARLPV